MIDLQKFSMGMTAAIMTSMGLIAGLAQDVSARTGIIAGLCIIAVADNISDSFSIHMYVEATGASAASVRLSTFGNFLVRFVLVLTFAFIVYFFPPSIALVTSSLWGLFLLSFLSYRIALHRQANPLRHTLWHIGIALLIVISSKVLGNVLFHFAS